MRPSVLVVDDERSFRLLAEEALSSEGFDVRSASTLALHPSVATLCRSEAISSAGSWVRSRITCQRIEGSESSSQSMTFMSLPRATPC